MASRVCNLTPQGREPQGNPSRVRSQPEGRGEGRGKPTALFSGTRVHTITLDYTLKRKRRGFSSHRGAFPREQEHKTWVPQDGPGTQGAHEGVTSGSPFQLRRGDIGHCRLGCYKPRGLVLGLCHAARGPAAPASQQTEASLPLSRPGRAALCLWESSQFPAFTVSAHLSSQGLLWFPLRLFAGSYPINSSRPV